MSAGKGKESLLRMPVPLSSRPELLGLLAGVVLWELTARHASLLWLPPPSRVLEAILRMVASGEILSNLAASLEALAIGFGIALAAGLAIGLLMGLVRVVGETLEPFVNALLISPSIAFAPIFFALFGLARATQIAVIVMYALFVIIVNTATGVRFADARLSEMATAFGAPHRKIITRVVLPAALPMIFAGIRLAMGRAVKGMINGEMVIAFVGMGALAQSYGSQLKTAEVAAIAVIITSVALILNAVVERVERHATHWAD